MKKTEIKVGGSYKAKVGTVLTVVIVEAVREKGGKTYWDVLDQRAQFRTTFSSPTAFVEEVKTIEAGDLVTVRDGAQVYMVESVSGNVVKTKGGPTVTRAFCHPVLSKVAPPPPVVPIAKPRASVPPGAGSTSGTKAPPIVAPSVTEVVPAASYSLPYDRPEHWTDRWAAAGRPKGWIDPGPSKAEMMAVVAERTADQLKPPVPLEDLPEPGVIAMGGPIPAFLINPNPPVSALSGLNKAVATEKAAPRKSGGGPKHLIVTARAGTGKTTTLVQGMRGVMGMNPRELVTNRGTTIIDPMEQQGRVWEEMKRGGKPRTVCFAAFNRSIATELKTRVPQGTKASTINGLGFGACHKNFRLKSGSEVNEYRTGDIIGELLGRDPKELRTKEPTLYSAACQLVSLAKMNLTELDVDPEGELDALAAFYDIQLYDDRGNYASRVFDLVPKVLLRAMDVNKDGCVDYDDQVWLPVALNLPVWEYDMLLVDEFQDLNRCQHALIRKAGRRLICCGDNRQAIYGFAGADSRSMDRMREELGNTSAGVMDLPLTVTRRCGKKIVEEARKLVPDFEAWKDNPEGIISTDRYQRAENLPSKDYPTYHKRVEDGNMVLCRVNAPLVSQCFKFLKEGRKANIQGRNVGQGLINTMTKVGATTVPELITKMEQWLTSETAKENARKNPSEQRLIALQDKFDCLMCFTEGANTVPDVTRKIESVFTDQPGAGIRLSSIHKSKGLESDRVFLLEPEGATVPHPMALKSGGWQLEQDFNLRYVATTRAITELVYVR